MSVSFLLVKRYQTKSELRASSAVSGCVYSAKKVASAVIAPPRLLRPFSASRGLVAGSHKILTSGPKKEKKHVHPSKGRGIGKTVRDKTGANVQRHRYPEQ